MDQQQQQQQQEEDEDIPPPPPPLVFPVIDVWNNKEHEYDIHYVTGKPWTWVMNAVKTEDMHAADDAAALPLAQQQSTTAAAAAMMTPTSRAGRRRTQQQRNKTDVPATLRIEVVERTSGRGVVVVVAWHGTSSAFDGLEDKDALVRTIQRCRVPESQISPASVLITWDVSLEECRNVIGKRLPTLASNTEERPFAVLKEPMGSQGKGIYFVRDVDEIHQIVDQHHQRARAEPDVLDALIASKNRIPSWVLQAEVTPCLLIRNGRKFHIRSYVVIVERPENDEVLDLYIYQQHEARIAGVPVNAAAPDGNEEQGGAQRNRLAHITNGALSSQTERSLMSMEPELQPYQNSLDIFIAETFAKHLLPDISRRVQQHPPPTLPIREFAVAGLDLMLTTDGRWYLLEVNVHPGAPTQPMAESNPAFAEHMKTFWKSLIDLVAGKSVAGFQDAFAVLEQAGITN
uniref:Tubulin--tyrosine ligase n=1 Tax=Amphora coffeiformis TaxID=265554 RepID=A0A7S3P6Q6_9STRA|eukprot:scaffold6038_cov125-Amphora_coffeaeformis.AAC.3